MIITNLSRNSCHFLPLPFGVRIFINASSAAYCNFVILTRGVSGEVVLPIMTANRNRRNSERLDQYYQLLTNKGILNEKNKRHAIDVMNDVTTKGISARKNPM